MWNNSLWKLHTQNIKTSVESIEDSGKITVREGMKSEIKVATRPSHSSAPEITVTVASFRIWRSSQFIVAREPERVTISRALYIKKTAQLSFVVAHLLKKLLTTNDQRRLFKCIMRV
jgi:hypothetical protein